MTSSCQPFFSGGCFNFFFLHMPGELLLTSKIFLELKIIKKQKKRVGLSFKFAVLLPEFGKIFFFFFKDSF